MRVHCSASLFCFSLEAVDSVLVEKLDLLCFPRPVHVDDALVARAAEMEGEIALGFFVGAVDEDVDFVEERGSRLVLLSARRELLEREATVAPDVESERVDLVRELCERRRLEERLAAAQGDAGEQGIRPDLLEDVRRIHAVTALERLGLRILAAVAAAAAALHEDREAAAVAVDDGVVDDPGDIELHQCRPCLTRSCSSARFASFQRSIVPTR